MALAHPAVVHQWASHLGALRDPMSDALGDH